MGLSGQRHKASNRIVLTLSLSKGEWRPDKDNTQPCASLMLRQAQHEAVVKAALRRHPAFVLVTMLLLRLIRLAGMGLAIG